MAATANYTQTMMYWHIGERINREVLGNHRAEYGKQIVAQVATQLQDVSHRVTPCLSLCDASILRPSSGASRAFSKNVH